MKAISWSPMRVMPAETAGITRVLGHVRVEHTDALTDLSLLDDLRCIDRSLSIEANSAVASLDGLENLRHVGEEVAIRNNPALTHADGINGVRELASLYVESNHSLSELPTFADGLTFHGFDDDAWLADLSIAGNAIVDLDAFSTISTLSVTAQAIRISITADAHLGSTRGLAAFASSGADVEIIFGSAGSPVLEELDLGGFEELSALHVHGWPSLTSISAPDLRRAWIVSISSNHGLLDLRGFPQLEEIGSLWLGCADVVDDGGAFETLAGLDAIISVGGLVISSLPALTTLDGLPTSMAVDSLTIRANPLLPTAEAEAFAAALMPEEEDICGNAAGRPCGPARCPSSTD